LLGNGDGTFASGTSLALAFGTELQIAEVNGDGKLDLATLSSDNAGNQNLNIALGNGRGTFQPAVTLAAPQEPRPRGCFRWLISITMAASTLP
jgi:hypothetical protein